MTAVAVVLAGGRGTRSADPSRAKLAQEVGGESLMAWHLHLLSGSEISEALVVAGHLGDQVQALCDTFDHPDVRVRVIHEDEQRGTMAALRLAADDTVADEFLVILGDILMSFPVDDFLESWRVSGASVAVAVHPSSHPQDSDAAFPTHDGRVLVVPKSEPRDRIPNMSSAGLFAVTRAALREYVGLRDIGSDVLPVAAADGDLFAYVSSHYFKDTGTPERLAAAQADFASSAFARRGAHGLRAAVFLDRDGVINPALPEIYLPEQYSLLPGVAEAIRVANLAGIPVLVATNQPGIAKGFMTFETHTAIRARMDRLLGARGAFVDDYAFCPHHPERGFEGEIEALKVTCTCRKPAPGLLVALADRHGIDRSRSVMVGDSDRDEGAARAAGVPFIHADEVPDVGPSGAILRAIEVVTC
jgi:mannose-1-phosphate guanylyltransferase/phosphomannomutase